MHTFKDIEKLYDSLNVKVVRQVDDLPDEVKNEIDLLIKGTDFGRGEVLSLIDKFTTQYLYTENKKYKYIKCLLDIIFINRNTHSTFCADVEKLKNAMKLVIPYIHNYDYLLNENDLEYQHHIQSIKYFKRRGYQINVKEGVVKCDQATTYISQLLEAKIQKLGIGFIVNLVKRINKIDDTFYLFLDSSNEALLTPFGYLFNLGVKYTNDGTTSDHEESLRIFTEILTIADHLAVLHRLQNYGLKHQLQLSFSSPSKLTELITRQVCRDQSYKIEQYDPKAIFSFIEFINTKYNDDKIKIIKSIFEELVSLNDIDYKIDVKNTITKTIADFSTEDIDNALTRLTNEKPNTNFSAFFDYSQKNYHLKPFFKNEGKSIYLNNTFCCVGFYHAIIERLEEIGIDSTKLGLILEEFVDFTLKNNNVNILIGEKKYVVNEDQREEMKIPSHGLESDGVFYNDEQIFFMEIKKRNLNQNSIGGNIYNILEDLSVSLIHSQTQANRHLRYLTKYGKIEFRDGNLIEHKNRAISKLSISSLEYGGLHSHQYSQQILHAFSNAQITPIINFERSIELINEKLKDFNHEIFRSVEDGIMSGNGLQEYMNCFFLNIFQLLYLVKTSKENDSDLINEINALKHIRLDQSDFYLANKQMRRIKDTPKLT